MIKDLDNLKTRAVQEHESKREAERDVETKRRSASKKADEAYIIGRRFLSSNNVQGAETSFSEAVKQYDIGRNAHGVACALYSRAQVLMLTGRVDRAERDAERALRILPNFLKASSLRVHLYQKKGLEYSAACGHFKTLSKNLATMYGKYTQAVLTSGGSVRTRPTDLRVERESARVALSRALEQLPENLRGNNIAAMTYFHPPSAPMVPSMVYVIGTNHVSKDSCDAVQRFIRTLRPSCVMVELCDARSHMLDPKALDRLKKVKGLDELLPMWRKGNISTFELLHGYCLSQVGSKLKTVPGAEFRAAASVARELGAELNLGDRPVHITIKRAWSSLSRWQKFRLVCEYMWSAVRGISEAELEKLDECMKTRGVLELMKEEFGRTFPEMLHTLCTERDMFMVNTLRHKASAHQVVVAVVGAAHVPGIREHWENSDINMAELMDPVVRKKSRGRSWLKIAAVTTVICVATWGIVRVARTRGTEIRGNLRGWTRPWGGSSA